MNHLVRATRYPTTVHDHLSGSNQLGHIYIIRIVISWRVKIKNIHNYMLTFKEKKNHKSPLH